MAFGVASGIAARVASGARQVPSLAPAGRRCMAVSSGSDPVPSSEASSPSTRPMRLYSSKATEDIRGYRPMTETVRTFLNPAHFLALLRSHGTTFFAGVPDSLLKDACAYITDNTSAKNHIIAANEGTALAIGAGHYMATRNIPCVYLQNSGLGNIVNPLLSMCSQKVYGIPVLLMIGWRGEPGKKDEPQHLLQGKLTPKLLEEMGVPYEILPDYPEGAFEVLQVAYDHMHKHKSPFALLVKKQTFDKYVLKEEMGGFSGRAGMLHREEVLEKVIDVFPDSPLITTTGFTSREIFELRARKGQSHEQDFLTVGSMGHCSSIALGVAISKPMQTVCVDGDGAAIMHLGSLVATGQSDLSNFKHVLINNAVHDSVGGQPTGAGVLDFPAIATACGYGTAVRVSQADDIVGALEKMRDSSGPYFLEIQTLPGARADLGRPTTTTQQNKDAFMAMLARQADGPASHGRASEDEVRAACTAPRSQECCTATAA